MKQKIIIIGIVLALFGFNILAQTDPIMPISSTDKFNYRGYLNGNVFVSNGNESISDYDGNLILNYEYPLNLPDQLKSSVTLTYNSNVTHAFHIKYGTNTSAHPHYINHPEWIIGFRGFAVQVLNFETNWYSNPNLGSEATPLSNGNLPLLIPGYHYSNKQSDDYGYSRLQGEPPYFTNYNDMIRILMADGSVKYFFNLIPGISNYLGTYLEGASPDRKAFAIVEDKNGDTFREMYYKAGDGFTYIFQEELSRIWGNEGLSETAKIMYLVKMVSNIGDTVSINYDLTPGFGRKVLQNIQINRGSTGYYSEVLPTIVFSLGLNELEFGFYDPIIFKVNLFINNNKIVNLWIDLNHQLSHYNIGQSSNGSRILKVLGITDEKNLTTNFSYNSVSRKLKYGVISTILLDIPLISSIKYPSNKKSTFEYYPEKFTEASPNLPLQLVPMSESDVICILINMQSSFRDCFTNSIIKKHKIFKNENLISENLYEYIYNGPFNSLAMRTTQSGIITNVKNTTYFNNGSMPSEVWKRVSFTRHRTWYWDYTMQDAAITIKKDWESFSDRQSQDSVLTEYNWDVIGWTFDLLSKNEKEFYTDDDQQTFEKMKTTSFSRVYNYIDFGQWFNKIKIIKSESATDPNNIISHTSYKSFWPSSNEQINKDFYYNLNSQDEIKVTNSGGDIKLHKKIEYYDDNDREFLGLKKKETNFPDSRSTFTEFEYFSDGDSVYKKLIKKITYSNNVTKNLIYPKIHHRLGELVNYDWLLIDTLSVKVLSDNLIEKDSNIVLCYYSPVYIWNPLRIITSMGGVDYEIKSVNNHNGQEIFATDLQNYLSSNSYDEKGRLSQVILPGSFNFSDQSNNDSILVNSNSNEICTRFISYSVQSSCSTNVINTPIPASFDLWSRINSTNIIAEDTVLTRLTEIVKKDSETDDYIGGGGGGTGSICNEYTNEYLMLANKIELKDAVSIENAILKLKTSIHYSGAGQSMTFTIKGITDSIGSNLTVGSINTTFIDNTELQINVKTILEQIMNQNSDLYGFVLSCKASWIDENNRQNRFTFDTGVTIPELSCKFTKYNYFPKNFTYKYFYDDENRIIDLNVRQGSGDLTNNIMVYKNEYDPFGNLLYAKAKNDVQQYEVKTTALYNAFNLNYKNVDGENRIVYTKYDYLSRPIEIRYDQNWGTGSFKKIEYLATADHYPIEKTVDETGKTIIKYFDKVGNLKKEEKINGDSVITTQYNYDDLSRLISVVTPEGKITSYQYDDHSNINQKTSPDEGTYKYKYDKYGNLRFSINTGNSLAVTFNKYDNFNRLILTGEKTFTFVNTWTDLDPDVDYSESQPGGIMWFENYTQNTSNFVLVNMYDNYTRTGVFASLYNFTTGTLQNLKGKLVATAFRDKNTNSWSYKVYSYDHLGRVKDEYVFFQSTSAYKKITTDYDNLGNVIKQNVDNQFYTWYTYDEQARLKEVRSNMNNAYTTAKLDAVYAYDKSDKVLSAKYGTYGNYAPKVLYTYDGKGRVSDINGFALDVFITVFQQTLTYYDNDNIHTMFLRNDGNGSWPNLNFTYAYDNYNRLTSASCSNSYYTENYAYDSDGNLTHKTRPYNTSQSLTYDYSQPPGQPLKNQLTTLTKGASNYSFTYDYKGNMLTDSRKSITSITYDRRNLPLRMSKPLNVNYDYYYDDAGQRIYKQTSITNKEYYLRDHTGKELAVYDWYTGKLKMLNLYGNGIFGKVNVSYNSQNARTDSRYYYIKDYLGSVRMTVDEKTFEVISAQDYFPFGGIMENRSYVTGSNINDKYKFTEKERDTETNYDYFGARYYDSELGRWLQVDPLADKYPGWSPYNYVENNPLKMVDPDGAGPWDIFLGVVDAFSKNVYGVDKSSLTQYENKSDYELGQDVGNVVSGIFAVGELVSGGSGFVGDFVAEVGSGGTLSPVVALDGLKNAALVGHGTFVLSNTFNSMNNGQTNAHQTYNGQKTDQYGNKLGPSGKPQQNTVKHSTMKEAKDAARNEGKVAPVKHTNPKKGNNHFHPTDKDGKKIPNSTHHEYPN